MKKFITIILIFVSMYAYSQRSGVPVYLEADTLKGVDTAYIQYPEFKSFYSLSLELHFEELGGTADGTCYLEAANDTNYVRVTNVEGVVSASPNDTITITDGLTAVFWIYGNAANNFRYTCISEIGDTVKIIPNYIRK